MHQCNPADPTPCNSWCQGDVHVDLAFASATWLRRHRGKDLLALFRLVHAQHHREARLPACEVLAIAPAHEAPTQAKRYPHRPRMRGPVQPLRVTYRVGTR